jgi:hypothetical protein
VRRALLVACVSAACAALGARDARAQSAAGSGRVEASAGAAWIGTQAFGSADANETTPTNGTLRLFSTSSELAGAPVFDVRVGVRVVGTLVADVDASYARPELRITTANDAESATAVTAVEPVEQFTIGGGLTWYAPTAGRVLPFVSGGGGYLRQLHDRKLLVETGNYFQVGGGAVYLFTSRTRGLIKVTGIRVDARAVVFRHGVAFDGGAHVAPAVAGSFLVRF